METQIYVCGPNRPLRSSSSQVKVLFAGQDIDRSPFIVNVSKAMGDPTRVQARGLGLQPMGNVANKPTYFDIYTAGKSLLVCLNYIPLIKENWWQVFLPSLLLKEQIKTKIMHKNILRDQWQSLGGTLTPYFH